MAAAAITKPRYPIIYVRGYAGRDADVEETVADPYMGFNLGSTKLRQLWTGDVERYYFESPVVRLMKDFDYRDIYSDGLELAELGKVHPRCIVIYRYYDKISDDFGDESVGTMEEFAIGLGELILQLRERLDVDEAERKQFRVYLVGHSMGGLVIRCFLQNQKLGDGETSRKMAEARPLVDKVFTYATPHNGIEAKIIGNVSGFFSENGRLNFNRIRMAQYLGLKKGTEPVNTLGGRFDPDRFFCLVGTNPADYVVAQGWSSRVVGPYSDGLVRVNNAVVHGPTGDSQHPTKLAPRAYVHRSHSGHYGIVNSEEGYQNLTRFLFGDIRVDGVLDVEELTLPRDVEQEREKGRQVRASYHFECITRVRGARWDLSRRVANEHSTVFRTFGELFPERAARPEIDRPHHRRPELFTTYLNGGARVRKQRPSLGFAVELGVLVPEYEVAGQFWARNHYAGGYIFREKFNLEAIPPSGEETSWRLRYGVDSATPNRSTRNLQPEEEHEVPAHVAADGLVFRIPVVQNTQPGIKAMLELTARPWNT
jgi:hypothetical protein